MKTLKEIGEICAIHRRHYRMTQDQVSKHTHTTRQLVSAFELGKTNNLLLCLWYMFNFNIDVYMFFSKDYTPEEAKRRLSELDEWIKEVKINAENTE